MSFSYTVSPAGENAPLQTQIVLPEYVNHIFGVVVKKGYDILSIVESIPGGDMLIRYIRASHKNDPIRTLFELALFLFALRYFFASKRPYDQKNLIKLNDREIDELVDEWTPEPLARSLKKEEKWQLESIPIVQGTVGSHVNLLQPNGNVKEEVLNMAKLDYLDLSTNHELQETAESQIRAAGVGACGPPNFYGTQDVHVRLEEDLAEFLQAERAILYGQDFCTSASVLPCFLKRGDLAIVDSGVNIAIQKAILISRCQVEWFNHNDMDHLEELLEDLKPELDEQPLARRFIVTEGLFENFGDSPDLNKICQLKKKFKYRLFLDESRSIGVLGKTGRGLAEEANVPRSEIEITIGSMALSFASSGGFCVGEHAMIHHQIISSSAYVFSAALPPYCAKVVSRVISFLKDPNFGKLCKLQEMTHKLHSHFSQEEKLKNYVTVVSSTKSPSVHIRLDSSVRNLLGFPESYGGQGSRINTAVKRGAESDYFDQAYNSECLLLQRIVDKVLSSGNVLISRSRRLVHHEISPVIPELMIHLNAGISEDELTKAMDVVAEVIVETVRNEGN